MRRTFVKTVAAGALTLVMAGQAALGADFSVPRYEPSLFSYWTGAYVGLHGGWGWTTTQGLNASGVFGGGQIGYNYQMGNFVFGVEGDGAFAHISSTISGAAFGVPASVNFDDDALASLRGRFGIAFKNILFYGTAGGGWGHGRISETALGVTTASGEAWHTAWSAGGGIEYAIVPNWSVKLEYLHYGLGSANYFGVLNTGNIDVESVKLGVNYLFH
jgi:outer membrane immunogenic protein